MMRTQDIVSGLIEAGAWYLFLYYLLYSIKTEVNLLLSAFILLVLMYAGWYLCPFIHHTQAWKSLFK